MIKLKILIYICQGPYSYNKENYLFDFLYKSESIDMC